jgi:hypothetical protein
MYIVCSVNHSPLPSLRRPHSRLESWETSLWALASSLATVHLKVHRKKMGDSWEDEEFEVPTFSAAVKESWDDEVDEAQVCFQWDNDVVVLF